MGRATGDVPFGHFAGVAAEHDLVFVDPDNGIEIPSRPKGRRNSSKYVLWEELELAWASGASLLIYQHFTREERSSFMRRIGGTIAQRLGTQEVVALRTARVAFFLVPQGQWCATAISRADAIAQRWAHRVTLERPWAALPT
jgi:hypothetical protein